MSRILVLESTDKKKCCYVFAGDKTYDICTFKDNQGRYCLFSSVSNGKQTDSSTSYWPNIDIAAEWAALYVMVALTNQE